MFRLLLIFLLWIPFSSFAATQVECSSNTKAIDSMVRERFQAIGVSGVIGKWLVKSEDLTINILNEPRLTAELIYKDKKSGKTKKNTISAKACRLKNGVRITLDSFFAGYPSFEIVLKGSKLQFFELQDEMRSGLITKS